MVAIGCSVDVTIGSSVDAVMGCSVDGLVVSVVEILGSSPPKSGVVVVELNVDITDGSVDVVVDDCSVVVSTSSQPP